MLLRYRTLALLLFLPTSLHCTGDVIRCKGADGKIAFSDQPCQSGEQETLKQYSQTRQPFARGQLSSSHNKSLAVSDGHAFWTDNHRSLRVILSPVELDESRRQSLVKNRMDFIKGEDIPGYVDIEFKFRDGQNPSTTTLEYLRVVSYGLGKERKTIPWTQGHGTEDLPDAVTAFNISRGMGKDTVELKYHFIGPYINWQFNFLLPVQDPYGQAL